MFRSFGVDDNPIALLPIRHILYNKHSTSHHMTHFHMTSLSQYQTSSIVFLHTHSSPIVPAPPPSIRIIIAISQSIRCDAVAPNKRAIAFHAPDYENHHIHPSLRLISWLSPSPHIMRRGTTASAYKVRHTSRKHRLRFPSLCPNGPEARGGFSSQ